MEGDFKYTPKFLCTYLPLTCIEDCALTRDGCEDKFDGCIYKHPAVEATICEAVASAYMNLRSSMVTLDNGGRLGLCHKYGMHPSMDAKLNFQKIIVDSKWNYIYIYFSKTMAPRGCHSYTLTKAKQNT